jgi:hypothetical protein
MPEPMRFGCSHETKVTSYETARTIQYKEVCKKMW